MVMPDTIPSHIRLVGSGCMSIHTTDKSQKHARCVVRACLGQFYVMHIYTCSSFNKMLK